MKTNFLLLGSLLVASIFLSSAGCNNIKDLEYKGIKNTQLQNMRLKDATLKMDIEYFNPNNFGLDVKETNLMIYVDDQLIGTADQPLKTQIAKNSTFLFPVVAHFDPIKLLGNALKTLFNNTHKVQLQGTAKIGKGGVYIKLPVNITEHVNLYKD